MMEYQNGYPSGFTMWNPVSISSSNSIDEVQPFFDAASFAAFLGTTLVDLKTIASLGSSMQQYYKTFYINKDTGKVVPPSTSLRLREINAPREPLKSWQTRLAAFFAQFPKHPANFAFMDGKNIKQAAETTTEGGVMVHVDLKDFFESHTSLYVQRHFSRLFKERFNAELDDFTLRLLVQVATRNQVLPQGSPCSPILTIILNYDMDVRIQATADKYKLTYTRWADDMYFTGDISDDEVREFINDLVDAVHPFRINFKKLNVMRNKAYPLMTGLKVLHDQYALPSTQSAKIAAIAKEVLGVTDARIEVTKRSIKVTPNKDWVRPPKEDAVVIITNLENRLNQKYPNVKFRVKPSYFYIQSIKKCLGLHILPGEVKFPRKKYQELRVEAFLMGMQRAIMRVYKAHLPAGMASYASYSPHSLRACVAMFAGMNYRGNKPISRNLLARPYNRRIFNGRVAFLQSIDPIKAGKIREIEQRSFGRTLTKIMDHVNRVHPGLATLLVGIIGGEQDGSK